MPGMFRVFCSDPHLSPVGVLAAGGGNRVLLQCSTVEIRYAEGVLMREVIVSFDKCLPDGIIMIDVLS